MSAEFERVDRILDRLTAKIGIASRLESEKAVVLWEEAVGDKIAKKTKAQAINNGVLYVQASNSMWIQELSLLKESIIQKLNGLIGSEVVNDIAFRIGDVTKEK